MFKPSERVRAEVLLARNWLAAYIGIILGDGQRLSIDLWAIFPAERWNSSKAVRGFVEAGGRASEQRQCQLVYVVACGWAKGGCVRQSFSRAILNVSKFGDTDIFPLAFERHIFFDRPEETLALLQEMHRDFTSAINISPPTLVRALVPVGYTGYRWATQIEPLWNAYYLALVLKIAERIEAERIALNDRKVFSYRYDYDTGTGKLFADITWRDYRLRTREIATAHEYVALTDIADFYPRIYHHRIDNALRRIDGVDEIRNRIMRMLSVFSGGDSYGLPVGGPASRILAELALNDVDRQLEARRINFCRYADDYTIGAATKDEAYRALVTLATKLSHEGLTLQKQKTKILTREEYLETVGFLDPTENVDPAQSAEDRLLSISVRFDPYSPNAAEDYENLKAALQEIDIVGILGREVAKASIDQTVARQAISAVAALGPQQKDGAIRTLLDPENILVLAPVFISVMRLVREVYDELSDQSKNYVDQFLAQLYARSSHVLSVDVNLAFYVQALAKRFSLNKQQTLIDIFEKSHSSLVRRQVFMAMIAYGALFWIREQKNNFNNLGELERRAFIVASYWLRDEGRFWRDTASRGFTGPQLLIQSWFSGRWQNNQTVPF